MTIIGIGPHWHACFFFWFPLNNPNQRQGLKEREREERGCDDRCGFWPWVFGSTTLGFGHGSSAMDLEKMIGHGFSVMRWIGHERRESAWVWDERREREIRSLQLEFQPWEKREFEMREYWERAFGSPSLSSVFVFGFSKKIWLMGEKFNFFFQKYNEKKIFILCYCSR